jgi:membrane associated rhomboid family serine protease
MSIKTILKPLVFERSGKRISLSRAQFFLAWLTFLPVYLRSALVSATVPDVPQGWVALLGVSGAIYAASKVIAQKGTQDAD